MSVCEERNPEGGHFAELPRSPDRAFCMGVEGIAGHGGRVGCAGFDVMS